MDVAPDYLQPYLAAGKRHGAGFAALLWASEQTQHARFNALARLCRFAGRSVLDVGCGRADLLTWLIRRQQRPHDYTGIEAVEALADAAEARALPDCTIVRADFVKEPQRLFVGADVVVLCGSLNTLDAGSFAQTLQRAFDATCEVLVFNFLCTPERAAARHLSWHPIEEVVRLAGTWTRQMRWVDDYLSGDCTMMLQKEL